MGKRKDAVVTIVDRHAPRINIQITEVLLDADKKNRHRRSVAHFTVTNLSGDQAKRLIIKAIEKASNK